VIEKIPKPIALSMAVNEKDKTKIVVKEVLKSPVAISTPSGPLCMRGLLQVIVEEDMDNHITGCPALDEMGFAADQHLAPVRDSFHLYDFSHVGQELIEIGKKPLGALSRLLLKPAVSPAVIEDCITDDPLLASEDEMPELVSDSDDDGDYGTHCDKDEDGNDFVESQPKFELATL
jgi:hypothetical protein